MDDKLVAALAGFSGAVIGSITTVASLVLKQWLEDKAKDRIDGPRKALLLQMLEAGYEWRKLSTLMHVIGADEETTKRLLLEIGARASETGEPLWALLKNRPLPTTQ